MRVEELVYAAAELCPGLTPSREQVAKEDALLQRDKDGHEIASFEINVGRILVIPAKRDPPIAAGIDGITALRLTLQGVESVTRDVHLLGQVGGIKRG